MSELFVNIDITDWKDETLKNESVIRNEDELLEQIESGVSTGNVAKSLVTSNEMGWTEKEIIKGNKPLFYAGAQAAVSGLVARQRHKVTAPSGAEYSVRSYVGKLATKDDEAPEGKSYVHTNTDEGLERATNYLQSAVTGHIWNRLVVIFDAGGDVESASEELKAKIDEMASRLI